MAECQLDTSRHSLRCNIPSRYWIDAVEKGSHTSCLLALIASFGLSVAWPSYSLAASVYTFTYTDNGKNPGWSASGYFSIPVIDFTDATPTSCFGITDCVTLPNTDITAASISITTPGGSATGLGLTYINQLGFNDFDVSVSPPNLEYGTTNYLVNTPAGCNPEQHACGVGIQAAFFGTGNAIFGPTGGTDISGAWVTTEGSTATPLPSTWLMLLSGFVGLGFLAFRGTKKGAVAITAA